MENKKVAIISDTHIGSERSRFRYIALNDTIGLFKSMDTVVLNGDTFTLLGKPSTRSAILTEANREHLQKRMDTLFIELERILRECPNTHFHYLVGNHDGFPPAYDRLQELAKHYKNLEPHYEQLILGDALFTHGDLNIPPKYLSTRNAFSTDRKRNFSLPGGVPGEMEQAMYQDICQNMKQAGRLNNISSVFIGHTHMPVFGYEVEGVRFYNSGGFEGERVGCIFTGNLTDDGHLKDIVAKIIEPKMLGAPSL